MDAERASYHLLKELLKPPLHLIAIDTQYEWPEKDQYDACFNNLEQVYSFFRAKRPKGRWIAWVRDSDGQVMGLDSQKWEKGMAIVRCEKHLVRVKLTTNRYDATAEKKEPNWKAPQYSS